MKRGPSGMGVRMSDVYPNRENFSRGPQVAGQKCSNKLIGSHSSHRSHGLLSLHACIRGSQRRTFRQYSSYSAPNILRRDGSPENRTNKATPTPATKAPPQVSGSAHPNPTHTPNHPTTKAKYM